MLISLNNAINSAKEKLDEEKRLKKIEQDRINSIHNQAANLAKDVYTNIMLSLRELDSKYNVKTFTNNHDREIRIVYNTDLVFKMKVIKSCWSEKYSDDTPEVNVIGIEVMVFDTKIQSMLRRRDAYDRFSNPDNVANKYIQMIAEKIVNYELSLR